MKLLALFLTYSVLCFADCPEDVHAMGEHTFVTATHPMVAAAAPAPYNGVWVYYRTYNGGKVTTFNQFWGGDGLISWSDTVFASSSATPPVWFWYSQIALQGTAWSDLRTWLLDASAKNTQAQMLVPPAGIPQYQEYGGFDPITGAPFVIYNWAVAPAYRNPSQYTGKILEFFNYLFTTTTY